MQDTGPLVVTPCRSACDWAGHDGLWSCAGCGSQWRTGEAWSPRQADGTWPPGVREALDEAQRG